MSKDDEIVVYDLRVGRGMPTADEVDELRKHGDGMQYAGLHRVSDNLVIWLDLEDDEAAKAGGE